MSDHRAEAARVLDAISAGDETSYANGMAYAQVQATLALVDALMDSVQTLTLAVTAGLDHGQQQSLQRMLESGGES